MRDGLHYVQDDVGVHAGGFELNQDLSDEKSAKQRCQEEHLHEGDSKCRGSECCWWASKLGGWSGVGGGESGRGWVRETCWGQIREGLVGDEANGMGRDTGFQASK